MDVLEYFPLLQSSALFRGIKKEALGRLLVCLDAREKHVPRGGFVLRAGDEPRFIGMVLGGRLQVVREGSDGSRAVVAPLAPGEIFAETLCCAGLTESPVSVEAETDAVVLRINYAKLRQNCPNACGCHSTLIENMLELLAQKNLHLQSRMELLEIKSVRGRVQRYFEPQLMQGQYSCTIPFNREQWADYLGVERTALSHELSRMRREGLLDFWKNKFELKW